MLTDAGIESGEACWCATDASRRSAAHARSSARDQTIDLDGQLLVPGFIDTQVNGGGGVLFNDDPSVESIAAIGRAHRRFGTTGFLPTLISDDLHVVAQAIDAVREAIAHGVPGVLGIHIEGPFLSNERRGVHDASKLRSLDERGASSCWRPPHGGVTMVTLAPECTTPAIIRALADAGVIVSAGHTNATYDELQPALAAGVRGFTHLFNAMSQLTTREPGAVGAALAHADSWVRTHRRRTSRSSGSAEDRAARQAARPLHAGERRHAERRRGRERVSNPGPVDHHRTATRSSTTKAGSPARISTWRAPCSTPARCWASTLADAVRMASRNPAEFLKLGGEMGRIAAGQRANLALVDDEFNVLETWIDGAQGSSQ